MPYEESKSFTDLIRTLSDFTVPATIVLVGVSGTISDLVADHKSITRAITQIPMPRMNYEELGAILKKGPESLGMNFEQAAYDFIIRLSQGLPHYTHLIGLHAVRAACSRWSKHVLRTDVITSLKVVIERGYQSIIEKYTLATRSAHQDAIFAEVLLACAITASRAVDALGYFQPASVVAPLQAIMPKRDVQISTFTGHLSDFCEEKRGCVLERTGHKRNYRYRFTDPLLPPFVIIKGVSSEMIVPERVVELVKLAESDRGSSGQLPLS